jgi:two-component system, chemotaxis family, sensor histidine kinase and response regulator PixL
MDTEQQIRLNFLDEAEEYFDRMESNLLGLANSVIEPQRIDIVLRAAHSIKGGGAMMGFDVLSRVAHRLEDFFKILRVRYSSKQITTEVETLLLQGVDCLRQIAVIDRQTLELEEAKINEKSTNTLDDRSQQIFEQLREHLGDLEAADENALLSQDEDINPALIIFDEGVNEILDCFENQLPELEIVEISQKLTATAQELIGFGKMASLEPFVQLCESIQAQATKVSPAEINILATQALKTWRRSHALVLRGRIDKLPSHLEANNFSLVEQDNIITSTVESHFSTTDFDPLEANSLELSGLQAAFESDTSDLQTESDFDPLEANSLDLSGLQAAFEPDTADLESVQQTNQPVAASSPQKNLSVDKMVRVPVSQLKQFNSLFEKLILDRNTINLRLQQFQNVIFLLSQRMSQMESSNTQLKQWYDRASVEGLIDNQEYFVSETANVLTSQREQANSKTMRYRFDALEMDSYSDIHLICQEQIETIVQLQEIAADIELDLQEINQAVRDLNYTTKSMQGNVTRTQMLPFAEIVKRFPRLIRDLNLQFNKQVNLKIIGENTLLDRSAVETLSDPLMHLLRNAFDHGIETPETRIAAGKSPTGTITIQASNQGTYTVITIADDGKGISLDKICDRLVQIGIPQEEVIQIPEAELLDFIFEPGFSTAEQVTELSGRGVGMDVVRTNLQEIRGDVRVSTMPGQGTTFTLKIPFTLSILKVAVLEQAGIIFAIPANSIRELTPLTPELIKISPDNDKYLLWNQMELPLVEIEKTLAYRHAHKTVNLAGNPAIDQTMALVVGNETFYAALQISRFWHEQESTIRPIDSPIPLPPGIISSMVFGDGKVIPLINPIVLIELSFKSNATDHQYSQNVTETNYISAIKTILVVDDSINVRRYLSLTLEKAGYQVEQAKDGQEAVDKLLGGLAVKAVICDIEMPRLDGYGVLEEIKERPEFKHLPIMMLTSRSNEKHRQLAMNLGATAYFSKPYNEQQLLEQLAEYLKH